MENNNIIIIFLLLGIFYIFIPRIEEYSEKYSQIKDENVKIFIDQKTGVEYLKYKNSLTPRLDCNGKVIIQKNKQP
ncbi:MAG: DUF6440 family protein [Fusobacteriales bacterium]|nr:DUF6440 family protein [Fusobacteriales bacterium]